MTIATIKTVLDFYARTIGESIVVVGYENAFGGVDFTLVDIRELAPFVEVSKTSSGQTALRLCKLNRAFKSWLTDFRHRRQFLLATSDEYREALAATAFGGRMNRGKAIEKLYTEKIADEKSWKADSLPWWEGPDCHFGGRPRQVKSPRATICTLEQCAKLGFTVEA